MGLNYISCALFTNWRTLSNFQKPEDILQTTLPASAVHWFKKMVRPHPLQKNTLLLLFFRGRGWLWRVGWEPAVRRWGLYHIIKHLLSYCGGRRWPRPQISLRYPATNNRRCQVYRTENHHINLWQWLHRDIKHLFTNKELFRSIQCTTAHQVLYVKSRIYSTHTNFSWWSKY